MYLRAFKLYYVSFFETLPFAVFYCITTFFINQWLPFAPNFAGLNVFLFKYVFAHLFVFIFFLVTVLNSILQVHANREGDIIQTVINGLKRFVPCMAPVLLITIMLVMMLFLLFGYFALVLPNDLGAILWFLVMLVAFTFCFIIHFIVRMCFTPLLIGCMEINFINGIKQSYHLISGRWFLTLGLFLPVIMVKCLLSGLFSHMGFEYDEIFNIFIMPFAASLLILYYIKVKPSLEPQLSLMRYPPHH